MTEPTKHDIDAESTDLVNSIILWRIYDALILLITLQGGQDAANKLLRHHEEGGFIGPNPSFRPDFIGAGDQPEPGR